MFSAVDIVGGGKKMLVCQIVRTSVCQSAAKQGYTFRR